MTFGLSWNLLVCTWNNEEADTHTHTFLPHFASIELPGFAVGEEALVHGMTELGGCCQAAVQRATNLLGFSEAHQARGVLRGHHKQTTCGNLFLCHKFVSTFLPEVGLGEKCFNINVHVLV